MKTKLLENALLSSTLVIGLAACDEPRPDLSALAGAPCSDCGSPDPGPRPLDVLFVVDNSGSMADSPTHPVADAIAKEGCAIPDTGPIPLELQNASPETLAELEETCGYGQLLRLSRPSVRFGVITTDVGDCDDRFNIRPYGGARRPQRGCLQAPDGATSKFFDDSEGSLRSKLNARFDVLGTYGVNYERGLDAMRMFLRGDEPVDGCESDRASFIRDDADLLIVMVSDEDDCSHPISEEFPDENALVTCRDEAEIDVDYLTQFPSSLCHERPDLLTPVEEYATYLSSLKTNGAEVTVTLVSGGVYENGSFLPVGCIDDELGASATCTPSFGLSNVNFAGAPCDPHMLDAEGGQPICCSADAPTRYASLVETMEGELSAESICAPDLESRISSRLWRIAR